MRVISTFLAAIAALAASARATSLTDCTSVGSATSINYDLSVPCYTGTFAAGTTYDINVLVPNSMEGEPLKMFLWNVEQSASYAATVQVTSNRGTTSNVAATNGCLDSGCTTTGVFAHIVQDTATAQAGLFTVQVTNGAGTWAFFVDSTPSTTPVADASSASTQTASYSVLGSSTNAQVALKGCFVSLEVIVNEVNISTTASVASNSPSNIQLYTGVGSTASPVQTFTSGATKTARFFRPPQGGPNAVVTLTFTAISTAYFNWANRSPYRMGSVTFSTSAVEYFPKVTPTAVVTMITGEPSTGIAGTTLDTDVVELVLDDLWWNITAEVSTNYTDNGTPRTAGGANIYFATNPTSSSFTSNSATTAVYYLENSNFRIANPLAYTTPSSLAPLQLSPANRYFLRIAASNTQQPTNTKLTHTVRITTETIEGSCRSYADCYASSSSDHPSLRSELSSDGTPIRLRDCVLVPTVSNPYRPRSQCSECSADCDCGEGEYCHLDAGICTNPLGVQYTCDAPASERFGLCQKKDPTGTIIGGPCRSNTGAKFSDGPTRVGSGATLALYANRLDNSSATFAQQTGYRFCGLAAFYNASNEDGATAANVARNATARTVYWNGQCLDGVCHECNTGTSQCSGARQCIQGRSLDNIVVDGTARTLSFNSSASALVAIAVFIAFIFVLVTFDCFRRHQWHAEDLKQRKLNEQRRRERAAAAASGNKI